MFLASLEMPCRRRRLVALTGSLNPASCHHAGLACRILTLQNHSVIVPESPGRFVNQEFLGAQISMDDAVPVDIRDGFGNL